MKQRKEANDTSHDLIQELPYRRALTVLNAHARPTGAAPIFYLLPEHYRSCDAILNQDGLEVLSTKKMHHKAAGKHEIRHTMGANHPYPNATEGRPGEKR